MKCPNCDILVELIQNEVATTLVAVEATDEQKKDAKEFADKVPGAEELPNEEVVDGHEDDAPGESKTQPE